MFTGIVDAIGTIENCTHRDGGINAKISAPYESAGIALGASISCDGVCLTVTNCLQKGETAFFDVDISPETVNVTNLGKWIEGTAINLERAMCMGDEIGGHIVSGHVDGLAKITSIKAIGENTVITFDAPENLARFIATKGSACLNGTSLTINSVDKTTFSVNIIPHTMQVTNWKTYKLGDQINLEIDMLARYVARLREFD